MSSESYCPFGTEPEVLPYVLTAPGERRTANGERRTVNAFTVQAQLPVRAFRASIAQVSRPHSF